MDHARARRATGVDVKPKNTNATGKAALERRNASGQGEEKKDEQQEQQQSESAQQQQRLGNAAIQSLMGHEGGDRGADASSGMLGRAKRPDVGQFEHGGVDDGDGPGDPGDLDDVWDFLPRTTQPEDKAGFHEDMPLEDLPDEDEGIRVCAGDVNSAPPFSLSLGALLGSVAGSARASATFAAEGAIGATLWTWLSTPPVALQSPDAEPLAGRLAHLAAVQLALTASPTLQRALPPTHRLAWMIAEIGARHELARRVGRVPEEISEPLTARFLAGPWLEGADDTPPSPMSEASRPLWRSLAEPWLAIEDPRPLVPALTIAPPSSDPDDPLGLDALVASFLAPRETTENLLSDTALDAAERIAWRVWQLRLHLAGHIAAFVEAAEAVNGAGPALALQQLVHTLDARTDEVLQLLGEIARAARSRVVPVHGLRNGLRRAAERTFKLQQDALDLLGDVTAGACLGETTLTRAAPMDPALAQALRDGDLRAALAALEPLPQRERDAATVFVKLMLHPREIPDVARLPPALRPLGALVELFAAWRAGDEDWTLAIADSLRAGARQAQDGPMLAVATLVGYRVIAPHHPALARHTLIEAIAQAAAFGSETAVSAIARIPSPRPGG